MVLRGAMAYNGAKVDVVGSSRSPTREVGTMGIRVNVASPGRIMTPRQFPGTVTEPSKRDVVETQRAKTLLTAQHVTPLTLFLLSAASAGMSSQNVVVDGGKFFC